MTFRQALSVIWQRWVIVVAVLVVTLAVAAIFLVRQTPVYTSSTTVRMSALASAASSSGQIGTATVDFDPATITSTPVVGPAAKKLGESQSDATAWNVTYTLGAADAATKATVITITADGGSAAQAQKRVDAVVAAYDAYLTGQLARAKAQEQAQVTKWTTAAQTYQAQVNANPANSIAQSNLANAINSLSDANTTIEKIDNAGKPLSVTTPASPGEFQGTSPLIAVLVALAAGLVAGIGIALISDVFDDRLRGDTEIDTLTGVPALGELSLDKRMQRRGDWLPTAGRKRTSLNEGLRALRTTLQVLLPRDSAVIVITSVEPGDGKSFISSNLALAWARTGKRVVLVGGDLRKPRLDKYFGDVATGQGLTELLQAAAVRGVAPSTEEVAGSLKATKFRGLRILPAGGDPWDPADLLAVDALGDIIASLRSLCDVVVIDSPPALALVDASLLAGHSDGAVLVASVKRTRRRRLTETVHALLGNGIVVLGVVANRSRRRIPRSYSAYYGAGTADRRRTAAAERAQATPQASASPGSPRAVSAQAANDEVASEFDDGFIDVDTVFDDQQTTNAANGAGGADGVDERSGDSASDVPAPERRAGRRQGSAEDEKV